MAVSKPFVIYLNSSWGHTTTYQFKCIQRKKKKKTIHKQIVCFHLLLKPNHLQMRVTESVVTGKIERKIKTNVFYMNTQLTR